MNRKTILVTGIGGNVGQGILRNIIQLDYDVFLIGTNTTWVSGGNHLCDKVYQVPFSKSPDYIYCIQKICQEEQVDLIIPSTDYEIHYLALSKDKLPLLAASNSETTKIFLNKYLTSEMFAKFSIPFAKTILPSCYRNDFTEYIVKPLEGRGSREISINPQHPEKFSDDYIIQQLYKGKELTTAFYITRDNNLLGHITFERTLDSGATMACEVTFQYNNRIEEMINKIMENFKIRGSCNIQSIADKNGIITPFEINCRISGTNSVRSQFGFEDVKYTIEEYLFNKIPKKPIIKKGAAVRLLMDVIYPDINLKEIKNKSTKHYIF